jgi:hypothetical protein
MIQAMTRNADKETDVRPADVPAFPPTDATGEVDLCLIDKLLDLTPAERLQWHAEFIEFASQQRELRMKEYGFDPADIGVAEEAQ